MLWEASYRPDNIDAVLADLVENWKDEDKKVFVLKAEEDIGEPTAFFEKHFAALGTPCYLAEDVAQGDRDNQRSGALWFEVRYDPSVKDAYRHSPNAQPLHTDGSYIPSFPNSTLMTCVASADDGGETIFVSADELIASLERDEPELLERLSSVELPHARSGDRRVEKVIDRESEPKLLNWNYYCVAKDVDGDERAMVEKFFTYLTEAPGLREHITPVKLRPGDAVVWKDREVLHGRNAFHPKMTSERFLWKCAFDVGVFED